MAVESAPAGQDLVQRDPGGGVEAGSGGGKLELSLSGKKEFSAKYATVTLEPGAAIMAEFKAKKESAAGASVSDGGAKVNINVYKFF